MRSEKPALHSQGLCSSWFRSPRFWQTLAFVLADAAVIVLALYLAFVLRFDGTIPARYVSFFGWIVLFALAIKIPIFAALRMYRFVWAYVGVVEVTNAFLACFFGALALGAVLFALHDWPLLSGVPRSILAIDFALVLIGVVGIRLSKRLLRQARRSGAKQSHRRRALIVGAGDAGAQLVRAIQGERQAAFWPIGFVDDDPGKRGVAIHGVRVLGPRDRLPDLIRSHRAEAVIIAMPSAPSAVIRETVNLARQGEAREVKIVPFLSELYTGEVKVSEVREIEPEDLLGREQVAIDTHALERFLAGKAVLITGAAGSIGAELCRQVLRFKPRRLLALDFDETGLFHLERELGRRFPERDFAISVGDVRDRGRIVELFRAESPEVVFHAAAYKHVPLMEAFPGEAVKTNVFGTKVLASVARESGVAAFVFISTDKAVNPTSVMGATKRLAEMVVLTELGGTPTRGMAVRFGNVLGSRGSVLPVFAEQIRHGGPVTVTHPDMKRYFMTTAEAVLLVLQAAAMGRGGEVFLLDMGEPVRILDLAKDLIRFHNLEPDRDVPIVFTGVRPGEKLFEEVLTAEEGAEMTAHKLVFVAKLEPPGDRTRLDDGLGRLREAAEIGTKDAVLSLLRALVPTYRNEPAASAPPPSLASSEGGVSSTLR